MKTSKNHGTYYLPFTVYQCQWDISTHILTKRMTNHESDQAWSVSISTHILTKRMTMYAKCFNYIKTYFNSHPHEEDDMTDTQNPYCISIFQLTSSRRGWRAKSPQFQLSISFQLTSSRRGWQADNREKQSSRLISTHILTKRMTEIWETNLAVA